MTSHEEKSNHRNDKIKKLIKELPLREKMKSVALLYYLDQKKKLDVELEEEIRMLKKHFEKIAQPFYQRASEIIEGQRIPNEEELKEVDTYLKEEEVGLKLGQLTLDPINQYWFNALKNCDIIAQEIKEKDEPILANLIKIEYLLIEHSENFSIQFHFKPNDHFHDLVLKKTFILKDGYNPIKTDATTIDWKENKNPTKKSKGGKKKSDQKDVEPEAESFFNFFKPINLEDEEWLESQKEEERKKIAERMDKDYDIAKMIKDEIIPYSLEYFLKVKINDGYDDAEDLDDASFEEIDSEEDDEEQNKQKNKITNQLEKKNTLNKTVNIVK